MTRTLGRLAVPLKTITDEQTFLGRHACSHHDMEQPLRIWLQYSDLGLVRRDYNVSRQTHDRQLVGSRIVGENGDLSSRRADRVEQCGSMREHAGPQK